MVSDSELVDRLREFLSTSDLNITTNTDVRRKLEEDFNIDLSDRKVFIREQIDLYLESHYQVNQENENNEEKMEEENDQGPPAEVKSQVSEEEEDQKEEEEEEDPEEEEEEESEAVAKLFGLGTSMLEVSSSKPLANESRGFAFWVELVIPGLPSAGYLSYAFNSGGCVTSLLMSGSALLDPSLQILIADQSLSNLLTQKFQTLMPGKKNESGKRKAGGFTKLCSLSPQLQKITGEAELARTEVVKRMWHYINENDLKNPSDKRIINCDDTLRELFGVDTIGMFEMNKALTKHIWPLDSDGVSTITTSGSVNSTANKKQRKQEEDEDSDEPKKEEKQKNSGMHAALRLSNVLINFLGTGESELSRPNVEGLSRFQVVMEENYVNEFKKEKGYPGALKLTLCGSREWPDLKGLL
ncbi:hypothetical protein KY289_015567 [Solanum tuberosum]|nr:hypothetical protein KY284_015622 [Solanum tuberosum]KAH0698085.1 hypothetical protein KY289_015567 [Solanum tuberosum]